MQERINNFQFINKMKNQDEFMNIPEYLHFDNHALSGVLHVNILNGYY